jgi:hypothetical protein
LPDLWSTETGGWRRVPGAWSRAEDIVEVVIRGAADRLLLTLVIFAEKALPQGRRTSVVVGGTLIGLGLAVGSGAVSMPWAA